MKKVQKKMEMILKKRSSVIRAVIYAAVLLVFDVTNVYAAAATGISQIDSALSFIKKLFLGLLSAIGLIILIKSIGDTAQAYQQADSHGMFEGAKGIAAGLVMVFIGAILTALGIS